MRHRGECFEDGKEGGRNSGIPNKFCSAHVSRLLTVSELHGIF